MLTITTNIPYLFSKSVFMQMLQKEGQGDSVQLCFLFFAFKHFFQFCYFYLLIFVVICIMFVICTYVFGYQLPLFN